MISLRNLSPGLDAMMPLILERLAEGGTVRFTPHGSSMRPMLVGGRDQVVLAPVPPRLRKYDLPLYRRADGRYVLHRVVHVGEDYTCIGDNQYTLEPHLTHDQMLAVVVAFVRNGRTHSVTSLGYRLYCRLWHHTRPLRHFVVRGVGFVRRRLPGHPPRK